MASKFLRSKASNVIFGRESLNSVANLSTRRSRIWRKVAVGMCGADAICTIYVVTAKYTDFTRVFVPRHEKQHFG